MRIFISAGEPSGDLHGANLIRELRHFDPTIEFAGFGGERMQAAGCRLLYPLCQIAIMWFARVLAHAPVFLSLISLADRFFRHRKPDAVILIDYPGFNWWMARRAHFHGIPVFYFVPPQLWAWLNWRVKKMQRWVDHVLCSLPFEKAWYEARGVHAHYVGHPYFDELHRQQLDQSFLRQQRAQRDSIIGLLPGSRQQELQRNGNSMVRAARHIYAQRPDCRFLVACFKEEHRAILSAKLERAKLPYEAHVGRTAEIIELAHSCIAVSGSVGLELLFRRKPSVIVYRIGKLDLKVGRYFKTCPYISLVNLLAGRELFPEYLVDHCFGQAAAEHVLHWLNDRPLYQDLRRELDILCEREARPGACTRVAEFILSALSSRHPVREAGTAKAA
jgi:lipid-A-disaccharide synthase